ncbi:MAG: type II toxin-antitoxin system HicA family toxin [Xenococcaceae cyanobacterium]
MPSFKPIKCQELIRFLKKTGFSDPMSGGNYQYMVKGQLKSIAIANFYII